MMLDLPGSQILLIILWLAYFTIHSILASVSFKQFVSMRLPGLIPAYRLIYNILASILLVPPLYLIVKYPGEMVWQWSDGWQYLSYFLAAAALAGFFWTLRYYDSSEFLGTRQMKENRKEILGQERLQLSPMHRYVRHPWYALALVILWTRDMHESLFISAILITLYLILGSYLEERKLIACHGDQYSQYRQRVAGLIPLPWRLLSKHDAEELMRSKEKK